jgi:predicted amidohydrolase YtcJ
MDFDKGDTEVWIYKRKIYENRLKMPKEDLKNVKILKTIVGGKVVYEKK